MKSTRKKPIRVIVVVEGGVVQDVYSSEPVNLSVLDHDSVEVGGDDERKEAEELQKEIETLKPNIE